jgi:ribose-phosphate pyrophosphokinase
VAHPQRLLYIEPKASQKAMRNIVVLGGSSHPALTKSICNRLGISEGGAILSKFSNGETSVQIQDSVRGKDVFIITTGCGEINEILMELFIMLSACKTASARRTPRLIWSTN